MALTFKRRLIGLSDSSVGLIEKTVEMQVCPEKVKVPKGGLVFWAIEEL